MDGHLEFECHGPEVQRGVGPGRRDGFGKPGQQAHGPLAIARRHDGTHEPRRGDIRSVPGIEGRGQMGHRVAGLPDDGKRLAEFQPRR